MQRLQVEKVGLGLGRFVIFSRIPKFQIPPESISSRSQVTSARLGQKNSPQILGFPKIIEFLKIDLAHSPGLRSINGCNQAIRTAISVLMVHYVDSIFWKMRQLFGK